MEHPVTAPWGLRITSADFEKLKGGFQPQDMEDRWACTADEPDQRGSTVVHWCRSWTGSEQIALRVNRLHDGGEIVEITWDTGAGAIRVSETAGKALATQLCRGLLGCEWAT